MHVRICCRVLCACLRACRARWLRIVLVCRQRACAAGENVTVPGRGLPRHDAPGERGDAVVRVSVVFPEAPPSALQGSSEEGARERLSRLLGGRSTRHRRGG